MDANTTNISPTKIAYQFPSRQWFGSYHCVGDAVASKSLYFESIDFVNGSVNAWLIDYKSKYEQRMSGRINFVDFEMELRSEEVSVNGSMDEMKFVGIVSLWQDGTVMYSGNVEMNDIDCTGFVFQGFVDTAPMEYIGVDEGTGTDEVDDYDDECNSEKEKFDSMMMGVLIGVGSSFGILDCYRNDCLFCMWKEETKWNGDL